MNRRAMMAAPAVLLVAAMAAGCEVTPFELPVGGGPGQDAGAYVDSGGGGGDGGGGDAMGACVPTGPDDTCDDIDNDCNGVVDDLFDKDSDGENCGTCGNRCVAPGAIMACEEGECVLVDCQPGFRDLDVAVPGCEYACPLFPAQPEDCNGVDDDCDGAIDEAVDLPPPPAGMCRDTPGTPCEGVSMICATRGDPSITRWYCDYPGAVEFDPSVPNGIVQNETLCDGQDGDCDGVADDPFPDLGQECDNGELGVCRDVGARRCDPSDASRTFCDLSVAPDPMGGPSAEVCNGLDDDCDGVVDNADLVADDMVRVSHSGLDFSIYRYEASRPDASSLSQGVSEARTCSKPGVLPWSGVTFAVAQAACAAAGKRLCTADEYLAACAGTGGSAYPYGDSFDDAACNAEPFDGVAGGADDDVLLPTGDGALAACVSDDGVHDLSGNLKEWTDDITGQTADGVDIAVLRGGAYDTPAQGATCDFRSSRAAVNTVLPTIGFRCCSDAP